MPERWTTQECADHLGIDPGRWRSLVSEGNRSRAQGVSHWAPAAIGYNEETGFKVWDADAVRDGQASRPGRGARTDLRTAEDQ